MKFKAACAASAILTIIMGVVTFNEPQTSIWMFIFALMATSAYFGYAIKELELKS